MKGAAPPPAGAVDRPAGSGRALPLIVANWKMSAGTAHLDGLALVAAAAGETGVPVVVCPPLPLMTLVRDRSAGLLLGAQDCHDRPSGPHTGSTSPVLLRSLGATHVIVGHSERRIQLGETDGVVRAKAQGAINAGLIPILCVGETASDRARGDAEAVIARQVSRSMPDAAAGRMVVAYEPVWSIGSGRVPDGEEIRRAHRAIRLRVRASHGAEAAAALPILYGGSVHGGNVPGLLLTDGVDGMLVGAASLAPRDFVPIIRIAAATVRTAPRAARPEAWPGTTAGPGHRPGLDARHA